MDIKAEEISKIIRDQIGSYAVDVDVAEVGTIVSGVMSWALSAFSWSASRL